MKIFIHDFAGHPFQVDLSRELAKRGHCVTHGWFAGDTGPKGNMVRVAGDPATLTFLPFGADIAYSKRNLIKRFLGDRLYGREVAKWIRDNDPSVVISGNTPTDAQAPIVAACRDKSIPFIYWCQDFYSIAVAHLLGKKMPIFGYLLGYIYKRAERKQMRVASHIIHITEKFLAQTDEWGIARNKVSVIPNWGAIGEIDLTNRDNNWSRQNCLARKARFVYSGTLARKHNPELLASLATALSQEEEVVLVSAGVGADMLKDRIESGSLSGIRALPLQPFECFPEVLGAADVLLAVIEREAGSFSVPSKILSYLCAGRPIVLAAPEDNLAAQIVDGIGAGIVVPPEDKRAFVEAALYFRDHPEKAAEAGANGRRYAEVNFDIQAVASRFEKVCFYTVNLEAKNV